MYVFIFYEGEHDQKSVFFHFVGSVGVKYELIICLDGMPVVVSV